VTSPEVKACAEEDGSTPGQVFPCVWHGGANGEGCPFVLDADGTTHYVVGSRPDHSYIYGGCVSQASVDSAHHDAETLSDAVPALLLAPVLLLATLTVVIRRRLHLK